MLYYLTAIGLIAHTLFWGFGLAQLTVPKLWRRWTWVFAPGLGMALQSAVVWAGAHTSWVGTNQYAWASEVIPLALLVAGWRWGARKASWQFGGLLLVAGVAGWLFLSPMAKPGPGLTSSSLGNCDPADYAAGARTLLEFSKDDRTGFLGLSEVTKVRSADYFFDFWLRLNHFTPSALIAHHAAIFGVEPYRLVSVTAAALVLLNLAIVGFLARVTVGLRGCWLLALLALYGFSPLNAYAVFHGQLGQLYAAQGIALLTVVGFGASAAAHRGRPVVVFLPLAVAAFWLLAGSYNFILPVCLAPVGAWLVAQLIRRQNWRAVARVLVLLAGSLALCAVLFWGRFEGLIERFSLFNQYNFGWAMPLFSPEALLGLTRDSSLNAWPAPIRWVLAGLVVSGCGAALVGFWRRRQPAGLAALALVLPVLAGWGLLAWETRVRANASYDAYKLLSVFFPGLLAGFGCWLAAVRSASRVVRCGAAGFAVLILAANLNTGGHFRRQLGNPPLRVNRDLAELSVLERDARFESLNLVIEDYWARLWANSFLLRKPQYFAIHTYEGRLNTALKGEWNLSDSLLRPVPLDPADFVQFNVRFFLVRASSPGLLQLSFGSGWYPEERSGPKRWVWSGGDGQVVIDNPASGPVRARLRVAIQSFLKRDVTLRLGNEVVAQATLDGTNQVLETDALTLRPGRTLLTFAGDGVSPGLGDSRKLAFALYGLELRAQAGILPPSGRY